MLVKFKINGKEYENEESEKVLSACLSANIYIPHICFLKGHSPSGHCGLCVIEVKKDNDSHIAYSCIEGVAEGIEIITHSPELGKIRRDNMTRIIKTHGLDCFRCFKTNGCKLQEYIYNYGPDPFSLQKEINSADSKDVYTNITDDILFNKSKCINCNRCVKFLSETCKMECKSVDVVDYSAPNIDDLFGNIIDVCPTAALKTNNGVWKTPSSITNVVKTYDVSNVFMPKLKVTTMNGEVVQICSTKNQWITNDIRFYFQKSHIKQTVEKQELPQEASGKIALIIPEYIDVETFFILQYIAEHSNKASSVGQATKNIAIKKEKELEKPSQGPNSDSSSLGFSSVDQNWDQELDNCSIPNFSEYTYQLVIDDSNIPLEIQDKIGISVSRVDCAIFVGIWETSSKFYIKQKMHMLEKEISVEKLEDIPDISMYKFPYVFISARMFPLDTSVLDKRALPFSIIPINSSQIMLKLARQYLPLSKLDPDMTKIEIQGKHFFEESGYYLNIFGEIVKTEQVLSPNEEASAIDFAQTLLKKIFPNKWEEILYQLYDDIRKTLLSSE